MRTNQIYIARDGKSGMHVLVRILAVDDIGKDYLPIDPDDFNKLMMARDVRSLVLAARDLGPMYISADILSHRIFVPSHLRQHIEHGVNLVPSDLESLLSECYFDPYALPVETDDMGYRAIGKVYVFDWSNYPAGSYRPRFNGNSLACCTAPYDSSTQIPSLGEGDYASIVFDNELSDIPQGNITYRWFKCAGLGSGAGLVAKELGSSPSLSLSGLQGSYINCEVTLTVNGKSKTFVPKAICNGKLSDGIYVRPRIG